MEWCLTEEIRCPVPVPPKILPPPLWAEKVTLCRPWHESHSKCGLMHRILLFCSIWNACFALPSAGMARARTLLTFFFALKRCKLDSSGSPFGDGLTFVIRTLIGLGSRIVGPAVKNWKQQPSELPVLTTHPNLVINDNDVLWRRLRPQQLGLLKQHPFHVRQTSSF